MAHRTVTVAPSSKELKDRLESIITDSWNSFLADHQDGCKFTLAVSGGSLIDILAEVLPNMNVSEKDGSKWLIFFADERLVEFHDSESTYGSYVAKLLPKVKYLTCENFVSINTYLLYDASLVAKDYEDRMRKEFNNVFPSMDLILLGMGPDGHTASLFPRHKLLKETQSWIGAITDSPKPPPCRITFTLPLINAGKKIVVVTTGSSKSEMISNIFKNDPNEDAPISLVLPTKGSLEWLIDSDAGKLLDQ